MSPKKPNEHARYAPVPTGLAVAMRERRERGIRGQVLDFARAVLARAHESPDSCAACIMLGVLGGQGEVGNGLSVLTYADAPCLRDFRKRTAHVRACKGFVPLTLIRALREVSEISREDFARRMGWEVGTLTQYELGNRSPGLMVYHRLAQVFGLTDADLVQMAIESEGRK